MAQIVWSDPALDQLDAIADYIALDKPEAARELVQRVFEKTDRVRTFTQLGRRVPELKNSNFRQVWINPCWIYYRVDGNTVYIVHIRRAERPLLKDELGST
ncbi:type II toxin-antitoxin system RelE/ParE family toxin [Opitutaceae bacterium]|nr:type II toxin-antitoxin system RelE/ParE family toxin [Opitutaceae bacterium]